MNFNKKLILIAFVGTLLAILWQEVNCLYLPKQEMYRFGMIQTADEASYLTPPTNFLSHGIWSDNSDGITRFYQRPPGYGSIYLIAILLLGKYALIGLKTVQIIGYFLSIILIGKIVFKLNQNSKSAIVAAIIAAILPMFSGFMYYSLTEGVTPILTLWTIFTYLNFENTKKPYGIIISTALLVLVRPQLILLPLTFCLYKLITREWKLVSWIIIGFVPFIAWQIRTFSISKEIPGLHPIYSTQNYTLFRPSHAAMTELFKIWEFDGEKFHSAISAIKKSRINDVIINIPPTIRQKVKPIFIEYEKLLNSEYKFASSQYLLKETKFIAHTNEFIK